MIYFILFSFSFLFTSLMTFLAIKFFPKLGLMDKPKKYGLKRKAIPYSGGIIIFFTFVCFISFFLEFDKHLWGVLIGSFLLVMVSFWDDRRDISPYLRLFVQLLAALLIVVSGIGIEMIRNPFGENFDLSIWKIPLKIGDLFYHFIILADIFTVFWILGMINTMNWVDGVNGMASGVSFIGFLILFFLSTRDGMHHIDQSQVAFMSIVLSGACAAFVLFEFHPAKILMGDTGSMFLGFMMAVLAIFSGGKVATAFLVMGFPILDAVWVFVRRIYKGKSPFKGDLSHFHHRLIDSGFTERKALLVIYAMCASFGGTAVFIGTREKMFAIFAMVFLMSIMGFVIVRKAR